LPKRLPHLVSRGECFREVSVNSRSSLLRRTRHRNPARRGLTMPQRNIVGWTNSEGALNRARRKMAAASARVVRRANMPTADASQTALQIQRRRIPASLACWSGMLRVRRQSGFGTADRAPQNITGIRVTSRCPSIDIPASLRHTFRARERRVPGAPAPANPNQQSGRALRRQPRSFGGDEVRAFELSPPG